MRRMRRAVAAVRCWYRGHVVLVWVWFTVALYAAFGAALAWIRSGR